jgi:molybdopterin-guanine dinucleotide biosynthesis protein A
LDSDVTAIVLAGGAGSRLGHVKKALLDVGGKPIIERVLDAVRPLVCDIIVADNDQSLAHLPGIRIAPDLRPRAGPLTALYSGLSAARSELCIVVASDMPFLNSALLTWMVEEARDYDAVVPVVDSRMEPMHAVCRTKACLTAVAAALRRGEKRMTSYLPNVRVRKVTQDTLRRIDPDLRSLFNVNTPADLLSARQMARVGP